MFVIEGLGHTWFKKGRNLMKTCDEKTGQSFPRQPCECCGEAAAMKRLGEALVCWECFEANADDDCGYDSNDPKHPGWAESKRADADLRRDE